MVEVIYVYEGTTLTDVIEAEPKQAWACAVARVNRLHYEGASVPATKGQFHQTPGRVSYDRGIWRAVNAFRNDSQVCR